MLDIDIRDEVPAPQRNGSCALLRPHDLAIEPRETLLEVLRTRLGLTGIKPSRIKSEAVGGF